MDITPEREKQVLFSTPYYDNSALFVGQQGKFTSIDQLKGKKVGVQNGTTHQKFITDKHPEITTVPYDSYQNAKLDLQNGRIDAVFGDTAVVTEWLKSNPKLAAVGDKVTDKAYFGTGLGIAVRQGNTDLQQKFNAALEKVKKDGTYQTIYNKWFQVRLNERNFSISKRRRDDRRPCRLRARHRPGPGDALCGTGVSEMAPGSLACNRHSDHPARATGNSGGAVYLFRLFPAAADAL